jgi:hypothetical protein
VKPLPDIFTSVQFWAGVATLWASAGAWFTYFSAARAAKRQEYEAILNLLTGIEAELELVSDWASGGQDDAGYPQNRAIDELTREHEDWFNPSRQIFTVQRPLLDSLRGARSMANCSVV